MNDSYTKSNLSEFSRKAMQRLHDRKIPKKRRLYIPSLDEEITIRNLTYDEVAECAHIEGENGNDADKYAVYLAVVSPDLKETARQLRDAGEIREYTEVVDIFDMGEITGIAAEVMKLSGVLGDKKVTVVEELKN